MGASRWFPVELWWLLVVGLTALLTGSARADSGARGQLTLLHTTADLLEDGPSERSPSWDKVATRRAEDESYALVALSMSEPGYRGSFATSAALRVELEVRQAVDGLRLAPRDASSFLAVAWRASQGRLVRLRVFPLDTSYLRLGYLHALDFGGTDVERRDSIFRGNVGGAPGLELALLTGRAQLFGGLKWARTSRAQRLWGLLAGGRLDLTPWLRVEAGFGYFQSGAAAALPGFVEGASIRLVGYSGADEPELRAEPLRPPLLRAELEAVDDDEGARGAALALEAVGLVERSPGFRGGGESPLRTAPGAGIYGSLRGRVAAAHFAVLWRSLQFVMRNEPRPLAPETFPAATLRQDELAAWLGGSVQLLPPWLILGVELGLRLPAAFVIPSALPGLPRTLLVGGQAGLVALPIGAQRLPVFSGRLSLRTRVSPRVSLAAFVDYRRDPNRTAVTASPDGVMDGFAPPDGVWIGAAGQARF